MKLSTAASCGVLNPSRNEIKCSVRKAKTFAKKRRTIEDLLEIYQAYHNLIDARCGKTPCMREKMVSKIWSWSELLHKRLTILN